MDGVHGGAEEGSRKATFRRIKNKVKITSFAALHFRAKSLYRVTSSLSPVILQVHTRRNAGLDQLEWVLLIRLLYELPETWVLSEVFMKTWTSALERIPGSSLFTLLIAILCAENGSCTTGLGSWCLKTEQLYSIYGLNMRADSIASLNSPNHSL